VLSRITVAQVGRQNEATVGFGDNTCGSILLPKPIGSRTRPRDVSIERRHFQANAARRGDTEPTLLSPRLSRFALFLSTDSAHPALRKRLLLAVFGRHHIAVSLYFTQRSFCQSDRHDRSLGGHARDAARCRCIDLSRRGGQLYFSVLLSFS
jgi:hypothetical protein